MQSRKTVIGVLVLVLCVSVGIAAAPTLTFTFTDVVAALTAQETDTYGISNTNAIAGDYVDAAGVQHGMILGGGTALRLPFTSVDRPDCINAPSSTSIAFYGINFAGVAAGWCTNTSGVEIGFTYANGKFTDIKIPGATLTNANGINDSGAVVGTYADASGVQHGFLLVGSTLTKLDPPGVVSLATAWGINNAGVISVYGADSNGTYLSFTTADKGLTYVPFHAPGEGSTGTAIHEINNNGDVVATVFDSSGNRHGVLYHGGQYYTYDDPNGVGSTRADGLNDHLVMVGRYGAGVYGGTGFAAFTKQ
jgi:probable HAF family extracellular repeat protein